MPSTRKTISILKCVYNYEYAIFNHSLSWIYFIAYSMQT